nr:flagellin [Clostridium estertheticum]
MIINHNLGAMNANRNMGINATNANKSMEKLSSGLRINKAGDDAAGLAISEKMRGQIRGLDQASSNAQDGISMIGTAEGALSETHSILQRMRELAVQSSNDTNVSVDRGEIQKEMDQLTKEVSRISNNTEFNTQKLINGGISDTGIKAATFQIGANSGQGITLSINAMDAKSLGLSRDVSEARVDSDKNAANITTISSDSVDVAKALADGKYKVELKAADAGATTATNATGVTVPNLVSGTATADTNITLTYTDHGTAANNTAAGAINATTNNMSTVGTGSLKINGVTVGLTNTKAVTGTEAEVVTALQKDIDSSALGSGKYKVTVDTTTNKLSIASVATGSATKVDLTGSDTTAANALGFSSLTSSTGTATGGTTDWVATGSLGGVVSGANNTVNGITLDQTKLPATAALGDKVTVKGFKDATLSAQLKDVTGVGVATATQSVGSAAVVDTTATGAVTGTATADTNVTLTYSANAGASSFATANVTAGTHPGATGNVTVNGTYSGASNATMTITQTAVAIAATNVAVAADMTVGTHTGSGGNAQVSGTFSGAANETLTLTKSATGWSTDGGTTDVLTDAAVTGGTKTFAYKGMTVDLTNAETNVATNDTFTQALTASVAAKYTVSDGTTTNANISTTSTIAGVTVSVAGVTAANGNTWTQALTAGTAGWTASGDKTGVISGNTNDVNGLNINMSKITGTPNSGETVTISAKVASNIGKATTIDQKNGGSYVIGDADGAGQMKIGISGGTAKAGTTTVNLTTDVATAATKQANGTMSDATVAAGLDISTQSKASAAVTTIQTAIESVSAERSKLGAYQNRLEHTIANLGTSSENLTTAESRIRDVDMAKEMSTFSKNNILNQAAQAMLAQANQQPQQVLQLLR